jgi:hypothetical protein
MLNTTIIGADDAVVITDLLREVAAGLPAPPGGPGGVRGTRHGSTGGSGLRDAAGYWATAVNPEMEPGDLQTVAWLLRDVSAERRVPAIRRDQARYWAAYLEGRMAGLDGRGAAVDGRLAG